MDPLVTLGRDAILATRKRQIQRYESQYWGGIIRYVNATVREKQEARRLSMVVPPGGDKKEFSNERSEAALLAVCCVDESGNKLFKTANDLEAEHEVNELMELDGHEVSTLSELILGGKRVANPQ